MRPSRRSGGGAGLQKQSGLAGGKSALIYCGPSANKNGAAATLNQLRAYPYPISSPTTIDALVVEVTVAGGAGAVTRLGIYSDNGSTYPGALLAEAGTADTTGTGVKPVALARTLQPGLYWLAGVNQVAAATIRCLGGGGGSPLVGGNDIAGPWMGYVEAGVSGALPATFTTTWAGTTAPIAVGIRIA